MHSKDDFIAAARSWIGTRWVHQGRNRAGVDCVGLLLMAAADIGIELPDMPGYRRSPNPALFVTHIRDNSLAVAEPTPGTFGIFRDGTQPCHVGIFAERDGHLTLIHAYSALGKVLEEDFIHDWPKKLVEVRAIEGIA